MDFNDIVTQKVCYGCTTACCQVEDVVDLVPVCMYLQGQKFCRDNDTSFTQKESCILALPENIVSDYKSQPAVAFVTRKVIRRAMH